jgi:hypothetical protein
MDVTMRLGVVAMWAGWIVSLGLAAAVGILGTLAQGLAVASVVAGQIGAAVYLREAIRDSKDRERQAFELGRESVRPIR